MELIHHLMCSWEEDEKDVTFIVVVKAVDEPFTSRLSFVLCCLSLIRNTGVHNKGSLRHSGTKCHS